MGKPARSERSQRPMETKMRELTMDELMFVSGGEGNACDKVFAELNVVSMTATTLAAGSAAMGF